MNIHWLGEGRFGVNYTATHLSTTVSIYGSPQVPHTQTLLSYNPITFHQRSNLNPRHILMIFRREMQEREAAQAGSSAENEQESQIMVAETVEVVESQQEFSEMYDILVLKISISDAIFPFSSLDLKMKEWMLKNWRREMRVKKRLKTCHFTLLQDLLEFYGLRGIS